MLASHVVSILVTGIWIVLEIPFWQLVMIVHGIQLVFLFTLLHETVHDTPFQSKRLNKWVGRVCGFLLFLPPQWFRYFHLAHHRYTHDPEMDPELEGGPIESKTAYLWTVTGIPLWMFHFKTLFRNVLGQVDYSYLPNGSRTRVINEARSMLLLYMLLLALSAYYASTLLLFCWIIPLILGQPFLRLYLMAEHGRCPHVANMLENSRTTYTNAIIRWLAWNMPYHSEHHAYPAVPFHKLPEFHEVAKKHLRSTENGYKTFHAKFVREFEKGKS